MKAKFLGLAIVASGCVAALPAYAHGMPHFKDSHIFHHRHNPHSLAQDPPPPMMAAPEIDPGITGGALTLLFGGAALLGGRRRRDR